MTNWPHVAGWADGQMQEGSKSMDFNKEVYDFLTKLMILVRRSVIFEKNIDVSLMRCDSYLSKP